VATSTSVVEAEEVNLAITYWNSTVNAFQEMAFGAEGAAATTPGVNLVSSAPSVDDPAALAQMFESATETSPDGVVLQALAADPFLRPVSDATAGGIPVIAIDAPPPEGAGVELWITNDNVQIGRDMIDELVKHIPEGTTGDVVIGNSGPDVPPLFLRVEGMVARLGELRPELTIIGPLSTEGATGTAAEIFQAWQGIVQANPDAVAYLAPDNNGGQALGLISEQTGKKMLIGGADLEPDALNKVASGSITFLASPEHWLKGYIAIKLLADHAQAGTPIPAGIWDSGHLIVNADNVDEIIARQADNESRTTALAPVGDAQIADPSGYLTPPG